MIGGLWALYIISELLCKDSFFSDFCCQLEERLLCLESINVNRLWDWHCQMNETTFDTRSCGYNPAMFIAPAAGLRFGEVGRAHGGRSARGQNGYGAQ